MDANAPKQKEIYMKKIKFLPLLLVAPLLTGCGNNVKAPKFDKAGEEVAADKFAADLDEKYTAASFAKEDKLGSLVLKSKVADQQITKDVRADKLVIEDFNEYYEQNTTLKYDAANSLASADISINGKSTEKTQYGKTTGKAAQKDTMFIQKYSKDGSDYAVRGSKKAKELQNPTPLTEVMPMDVYCDTMVKMSLASQGADVSDAIAAYMGASEEERKNYKFYENGNIFTVEYAKTIEAQEHKNAEDKVDYVTSGSQNYKVQIDLTDGKWKSKLYREVISKTEYKLIVDEHLEGEVIEDKRLSSQDVTAELKDVKLKAVDVSGYKEVF